MLFGCFKSYLLHVAKYLLSTPPGPPIVIVLWRSANANSSICSTTSSEKLLSSGFQFPPVSTLVRLANDIPVCLRLKNLCAFKLLIARRDLDLQSSHHPPGMALFSNSELCYPASVTRTELFESSARRSARTAPEVPPLQLRQSNESKEGFGTHPQII